MSRCYIVTRITAQFFVKAHHELYTGNSISRMCIIALHALHLSFQANSYVTMGNHCVKSDSHEMNHSVLNVATQLEKVRPYIQHITGCIEFVMHTSRLKPHTDLGSFII